MTKQARASMTKQERASMTKQGYDIRYSIYI